jgi:hypothetical protein
VRQPRPLPILPSDVRFGSKADVAHCSGNGRKGPVGDLRRGPPVREAWTNQGRVLRRLGEPNGGQDYGSHQLAAVPQSVLHGGSPKSRDPLLVFRAAYRSDTHARQATFGRLRIPLVLSVVRSSDGAKCRLMHRTKTAQSITSSADDQTYGGDASNYLDKLASSHCPKAPDCADYSRDL